jgi:hypothetical protein
MFGTYAAPGPLALRAIVTTPGGDPVETAIIWLTPGTEATPNDSRRQVAEERRVVAIRSDDVPAVPRGTLISCAEPLQAEPLIWITDSIEFTFPDHQRVSVLPAPLDT